MFKHSHSMGVVMSVLFVIQPAYSAYEWLNTLKSHKNDIPLLGMALILSYGIYELGKFMGGQENEALKKKNSEQSEELRCYKQNGLRIKIGPLGGMDIDASEYMIKKLGCFKEATLKVKKSDNSASKKQLSDIQETLKEWGFIQERKEIKDDGGLLKKQVTTQYTFFVPKIGNCDLKIEEID